LTTKIRLEKLRNKMKEAGIDAYIIPSSDPHKSEYVAERWKSREWISGFSGSAGLVIVTQNHAGLWTDSRYFLQAIDELQDSGVELHKVFNQFVPQHYTWLSKNLKAGDTLGFDGKTLTVSEVKRCKSLLKDINLKYDLDLIEEVWDSRPKIPTNKIFLHKEKYCGLSSKKKLEKLRSGMSKAGLDQFVISTLDDIAWLYNIRCNDVEYNPVAIAYSIVSQDAAILFINQEKISEEINQRLVQNGIEIREYDTINHYLQNLKQEIVVGYDPNKLSQTLFDQMTASKKASRNFTTELKAVKNETEIKNFRTAMEKDGVALTKTFMWLEEHISEEQITEYDLSEKLAFYRAEQEDYFGESFAAIVGYRSNGAVIHYKPSKEKSKEIKNEGVLLVDSGAQYFDGTTDITRTFCFDEPQQEVKTAYTAVLKGHIALDAAVYPQGTIGGQLDILARKALWDKGLNYLHGTGHGVGFFLNVHEDPQGFTAGSSPRANTVLVEGMITSNEPGYYKDNAFGIRIENLILTKNHEKEGFYEHETLTLFPIETNMIDETQMNHSEKSWLNRYHQEVYERLSPRLNEKEQSWLKEKCKPLG